MSDMNQIITKVHTDIFTANSEIIGSYRDSTTNELKVFEFRSSGESNLYKIPLIVINPPNTMKLKSISVVESDENIQIKTYILERDDTISSVFGTIINTVNTTDG